MQYSPHEIIYKILENSPLSSTDSLCYTTKMLYNLLKNMQK